MASTSSTPRYAVLERHRQQRRRDRNMRLKRDTAPLARVSRRKPATQLSLAESLTRTEVEKMLAERRTKSHVPRPTTKVITTSYRMANDDIDPHWKERQEQQQGRLNRTTTANANTAATIRCEVRSVPKKTHSLGCLLLRVEGIHNAHDLEQLVQRATTLPLRGLPGLLLDCRLEHVPSTVAYDDGEGDKTRANATTPSKSSSSSASSSSFYHTTAVMISVCSSMEDVRKLYHGYRKRSPRVRLIVCGHVLTFHAVEIMQYSEAKARGINLASSLPIGLVDESEIASASSLEPSALGTAFYRASKDGTNWDDKDQEEDNTTSRRTAWNVTTADDIKSTMALMMNDVLPDERDYTHLSPIERALRVLGDDVVHVKREFDERSMNGVTITKEQARRAISSLTQGVVPNAATIIDEYDSVDQGGEMMAFSELLILYSDKFYFSTLQRRHNTMKNQVDDLRNTHSKSKSTGNGGRTTTIVDLNTDNGGHATGVELEEQDIYDDDEEWETVIASEVEREKMETARSHMAAEGQRISEVEVLMRYSLQEEEINFSQKVNSAFRLFDVYGVDLDAIEAGSDAYDNDDDDGNNQHQGFIMLDDAPDALIAVGLPIERNEAESLVHDLSSGASTDFRGFNLTEFRMVCARVLSIFDEEEEENIMNTARSRSSKK